MSTPVYTKCDKSITIVQLKKILDKHNAEYKKTAKKDELCRLVEKCLNKQGNVSSPRQSSPMPRYLKCDRSITIAQLKKILDKHNVEYKKSAKKEELCRLVEKCLKKQGHAYPPSKKQASPLPLYTKCDKSITVEKLKKILNHHKVEHTKSAKKNELCSLVEKLLKKANIKQVMNKQSPVGNKMPNLSGIMKQLYDMKSGPCIDLLSDLEMERLRILLANLPNETMKGNIQQAIKIKMKDFIKKLLEKLENEIINGKKKNYTSGAVILDFKDSIFEKINNQFPDLEEKKKLFDILVSIQTDTSLFLSSLFMEHIIHTYTKELFEKKILFDYIQMIDDIDTRSEVMDVIGENKKYFVSKDEHRKFLFKIPNKCLAVTSTDKFAKNPQNFNSYQQRKEFIESLDSEDRIRNYRRLIKEYPDKKDSLNKDIIKAKREYNHGCQVEGLPLKYKKF